MLKKEYLNFFNNQYTHWWYKGMQSINTSLLNKFLKKKNNLKILDIGCGTGAALRCLGKYGDGYGVDISDEAIRLAKKCASENWVIEKGEIASLRFKNSTFDLVVCLDVLYHSWVKDNNKAVSEIARVLKKGGIFLSREPAYEWLTGNEDLVDMTKLRFSEKTLRLILKGSKLKILKITYANFLLFPFVLVKRLSIILNLQKRERVSDVSKTNGLLNFILFGVLYIESKLIKYVNLPFGSSVICVAKK